MKRISIITCLLFVTLMTTAQTIDYQTVPLPNEIIPANGLPFALTARTRIAYPQGNEQMKRNAEFLQTYISQQTGISLELTDKARKNTIVLKLDPSIAQKEGYQIVVDDKQVVISGSTPQGVFYGIQTLRKSLSVGTGDLLLPAVKISDAPRFGYRGMHLDVCRHFFGMDVVKQYIDLMALHQMNTFHFHLTEDQGWRIEIKKYPLLTQIGSVRKQTMVGHDFDKFDGTPHGGFYTQDELRELVKYAAERYITIIPEVDLPGHMLAALAAYPWLGCTGGPYEVGQKWGVFDDVLCLGKESTFTFLEDVLTEVMDIFPSTYIHIGGDEAPRVRWEKCPLCQARIKSESLQADGKHSAEDRLQTYCMARVERFLNAHGRQIIGWDEILQGDIAPNATIMSWRGTEGGIKAAQMGHKSIMTPVQYAYFDYYQGGPGKDLTFNASLTLDKVYSFNPCPEELDPAYHSYILGPQGNLWTEYIATPERLYYQLLPRMDAMSEVQWTQPAQKDYKQFMQRLAQMVKLYDHYGINYCKVAFEEPQN